MPQRWNLACTILVTAMGLAATPAIADESVSVHVEDDGTIVGLLTMDAEEAAVREILGDVGDASRLSADVLEVRMQAKTIGPCQDVFRTTRGFLEPMELHTERCPTETGWRETLVEVGDFSTYKAEWTIRSPDKGGVEVEYRLKTSPNMWVPQTIVEINVARAVRQTLGALSQPFKKKKTRTLSPAP